MSTKQTKVTMKIVDESSSNKTMVCTKSSYDWMVGTKIMLEHRFFPKDVIVNNIVDVLGMANVSEKSFKVLGVIKPELTSAPELLKKEVAKKEEPKPVKYPLNMTVQSTDDFYISPIHTRLLSAADHRAQTDGLATVYATGPSGYGKTSLGIELAKQTGRDYYLLSTPMVRDTEEWFFVRHAKGGSTVWANTDFIEQTMAGDVVIIIDEINRAEPWLANPLLQLMHFDRTVNVQNESFTVGPNVIFFMTANVGIQYTGTNELDIALRNRATTRINVNSIPRESEISLLKKRHGLTKTESGKLVSLMEMIRSHSIENIDASPRMSLNIAADVKAGLSVSDSVTSLVLIDLEGQETQRKEIIDYIKVNF